MTFWKKFKTWVYDLMYSKHFEKNKLLKDQKTLFRLWYQMECLRVGVDNYFING